MILFICIHICIFFYLNCKVYRVLIYQGISSFCGVLDLMQKVSLTSNLTRNVRTKPITIDLNEGRQNNRKVNIRNDIESITESEKPFKISGEEYWRNI